MTLILKLDLDIWVVMNDEKINIDKLTHAIIFYAVIIFNLN